jgi:molecular chaperone Hsp33
MSIPKNIIYAYCFKNALLTLGKDELQAMKDEDHGAEIVCQFCQTKYEFSEADLEELIND